jgi:hypothetical protein
MLVPYWWWVAKDTMSTATRSLGPSYKNGGRSQRCSRRGCARDMDRFWQEVGCGANEEDADERQERGAPGGRAVCAASSPPSGPHCAAA